MRTNRWMAITSEVLIKLSPFTSAAVNWHPAGIGVMLRNCRWTATTSTVLMPGEPGARPVFVGVTI